METQAFSTSRKISFVIAVITALFFAVPLVAGAQMQALLAPESNTVNIGANFTLSITVTSGSASSYGEKIEINYPADALDVVSFSYGPDWMPMEGAPYESTDDAQGKMLRTAVFPGGFTGTKFFGSVTFHAKKIALGTIKIGNSAISYEGKNEQLIMGGTSMFSIVEPEAVTLPSVDTPKTAENSLAASVFGVPFLENTQNAVISIVLLVLLCVVLFFVFKKRRFGSRE